MKELELKKVVEEIENQLQWTDYDLEQYIGHTLTVMVVMNIYLTNDILKAYGQNLDEVEVSIITTSNRCSIIMGGAMSWFKSTEPICQYNDLGEDIRSILNMIQCVIDRMDL